MPAVTVQVPHIRTLLVRCADAFLAAAKAQESQDPAAGRRAASAADAAMRDIADWEDARLSSGHSVRKLSQELALAHSAEGIARSARHLATLAITRNGHASHAGVVELRQLVEPLVAALRRPGTDISLDLTEVRALRQRVVQDAALAPWPNSVAPFLRNVSAAHRLEEAAEAASVAANLLALEDEMVA